MLEYISAPPFTPSQSINGYLSPLPPKQTQNLFTHIISPTQYPSDFPSPLPLDPTYTPFVVPSYIPNNGPSTFPVNGSPNLLLSPVPYLIPNLFTFRTLSIAIFYSRHIIFSLQLIINVTFKKYILTHKFLHLLTPDIESILNYNYIFPEPYILFFQARLYATVKLTSLLIYPTSQNLSHHCNHSLAPYFPPLMVPDQKLSMPTILYHHQYWLTAKLPQTTQVSYYLHKYTLLSIFSALAHLICRTFSYAFLHQSWRNNTYPFTPLINH